MVDGCTAHSILPESVGKRWDSVESLIAGTPEDDHNAQWSVICFCACCLGPAKLPAEFCTRCQP